MEKQEYIESGILELYVAAVLTETEMQEVLAFVQENPEAKKEIEEIEQAIIALTSHKAKNNENILSRLLAQISTDNNENQTTKVIPIDKKPNWTSYLGWAAAALFLIGLVSFFLQKQNLTEEKLVLEEKIEQLEGQLTDNEELITILRDKDNTIVPLAGQEISPESYATVYWNKNADKVYIDVSGLPAPPAGKTYQVWSLTLEPLTPTSIGLFGQTPQNQLIELENTHESQAFGITLEPEGGSEAPTMEQLYTLGVVES